MKVLKCALPALRLKVLQGILDELLVSPEWMMLSGSDVVQYGGGGMEGREPCIQARPYRPGKAAGCGGRGRLSAPPNQSGGP